MYMSSFRFIQAAALCASFAGAVEGVVAQPTDARTQRMQKLLDQLDAPSWIDRDLATLELARFADELSLDDLENALLDPTLSHEQRARLVQACLVRYAALPKGGLGVAFGTVRVGAVEVQPIENNPDFPATALLIPGDAIAMVDRVILSNSSDLRAQILSRLPGETLPVTIIRNNTLIDLDLPLGSYTKLAGPAILDEALARHALELRWARKGIVLSQPDEIGTAINQDQWALAAFPVALKADPQNPGRRYPTAMISGARQSVLAGPNTFGLGVKTWESMQIYLERAQEVSKQILRLQVQSLDSTLNVFELELSTIMSQLESSTTPEQRSQLTLRLEQVRAQVESVQLQLGALTTEQVEMLDAPAIKTLKPELPTSP